MIETYNIVKFPQLNEGDYENLGYLKGITIEGEDPYTSEVFIHFERGGSKKIYQIEGDDQTSIISEVLPWLKIQLLNQAMHGTRDVKLIAQRINGEIKLDMP